jgi:uncharacterized repeat protein (TIGR01451 family)
VTVGSTTALSAISRSSLSRRTAPQYDARQSDARGTNGGNNFCQTTLDDASAGASIDTLSSASNPFTGSFKPSQALSAFVGANGNGTWQLQATDFFSTDTGSIRTWSLDVRPLACAAVSNPTNITATKTVTGSFVPGGSVDYTVTLTNTGTGAQIDNPGDEFTDTLPPQLTPQSASASSGGRAGRRHGEVERCDSVAPA